MGSSSKHWEVFESHIEEKFMTTTPISQSASVEKLLKSLSLERRNRAIALLNEWMADESGYDEAT